jgi:hypothetical protein
MHGCMGGRFPKPPGWNCTWRRESWTMQKTLKEFQIPKEIYMKINFQ